MKNLVPAFVVLLLLSACIEQEKQDTVPSPGADTTAVDPAESESLETDEDRHYWQKPEVVINNLGPLEDKVVADLGAGIGYFSFKLLPDAGKVIAIEVDTTKINILKGFKSSMSEPLASKFDIRKATPDDPHLEDDEVDIVLIVNTIAYIDDRVNYFKNLKSSLRENGKIVIVDFKTKRIPAFVNAPPYEDREYLHVIEDELLEAGFRILRTDDTSLEYQFMIFATPY